MSRNGRTEPNRAGLLIGGAISLAALCIPIWLIYASVIAPWRLTNRFFELADGPNAEWAFVAAFAPDRRAQCCADAARWAEGLRGRSGWSFARNATSLGTTRGGRSLASVRGYVAYPGSSDERSFSITFIQIDGTWHTEAFSLGVRQTPR
jgi:hypothetical protein